MLALALLVTVWYGILRTFRNRQVIDALPPEVREPIGKMIRSWGKFCCVYVETTRFRQS